MAAFQTMNAIKRKMHKLKTDKENEYDRVDQLEQKLIELRCLNEKVTTTVFELRLIPSSALAVPGFVENGYM